MTALPTNGTTVRFRDGDDVRTGIVNGEPHRYSPGSTEYLPVHVPETNANIMVDARNLVADDD